MEKKIKTKHLHENNFAQLGNKNFFSQRELAGESQSCGEESLVVKICSTFKVPCRYFKTSDNIFEFNCHFYVFFFINFSHAVDIKGSKILNLNIESTGPDTNTNLPHLTI
jgi:hypothetical protein